MVSPRVSWRGGLTPCFLARYVLLVFLVFCVVFFVLFVFILCLVPNVARVSVLTIPEQLSSTPIFSGIRVALSIVFYVVLCRLLFFFLLVIMLSALLRFTDSDYHFRIFKLLFPFWCSLTFIKTYPLCYEYHNKH